MSGYVYIPDAGVPDRVREIAERVMERRGFWIKHFETKDEMRAMVDKAQKVLNDSFRGGHGFVEMTDEEFQLAAQELISIADPRLIKVVMKDDDIIGYLFSYHDIGAFFSPIPITIRPSSRSRLASAVKSLSPKTTNERVVR